jgi:hypothetical protein
MLKQEDFNIEDIREKAESHYHFMIKNKKDSYLNAFIRYYSMIFDGIDLMCGADKAQNGPTGKKVYYSVFSSLFFDGINIDDFFKKRLFFKFIKFKDLSHRYSFPDGDIYSKDFHTYTTVPNEKNIIKIIGGSHGSFDNYFEIDEFYYDTQNYIKKNGLIKYDFNKFQLHCCAISKKNSLIPRQFDKNYHYRCHDCKREIVIYGYFIPYGCEHTPLKEVPCRVAPWPSDEDIVNFNKSREIEEKQLYLNLTEIGFNQIYNHYLGMINDTYSNKIYFENYRFNDEFYNDDRELDDQSEEFWNSQ